MRRLLLMFVVCSPPLFAQLISASGVGLSSQTAATNNPVSLVTERKQSQTLADGTHISSTTHEYFYRDSLGRTRTETEFPMFAGQSERPRSIFVVDPVAGTTLNWQTGQTGQNREYNQVTLTPPRQITPAPRTPRVVNASPQGTDRRISPEPSAVKRPEMKHEDLGIVDVQGASCKATRITTTFPIDYLGNDRPISSTQEQCMSQEFGRALLEVSEDPRNGTRTLAVQSLSRGEPDPSLFQPPAGYTERVQPSQQGR